MMYGTIDPNPTVAQLTAQGFTFTLNDYPIFDTTYRAGLNAKILNHYRYNEVCDPDTTKWLYLLNTTLTEEMPYYNQLYTSAALSIDPLVTFSRTETEAGTRGATVTDTASGTETTTGTNATTGTTTGTQNATSVGASDGTSTSTAARVGDIEDTVITQTAEGEASRTYGKNVESDTPPGLLSMNDIETNVYASKAGINDTNATKTGTRENEQTTDRKETDSTTTTSAAENASTVTDTATTAGTVANTTNLEGERTTATTAAQTTAAENERTNTQTGYDRPLAELLKLHRQTFLNIDMLVIKAVRDCFIQVYESGY